MPTVPTVTDQHKTHEPIHPATAGLAVRVCGWLARWLAPRRACVWVSPGVCTIFVAAARRAQCPPEELAGQLRAIYEQGAWRRTDIVLDVESDSARGFARASERPAAAGEHFATQDTQSLYTPAEAGEAHHGQTPEQRHWLQVHLASFLAELGRCLGRRSAAPESDKQTSSRALWWQEWHISNSPVRVSGTRAVSDLLRYVEDAAGQAGVEIHRVFSVSSALITSLGLTVARAVLVISAPCAVHISPEKPESTSREKKPFDATEKPFVRVGVYRQQQLLCSKTVPLEARPVGPAPEPPEPPGSPSADAPAGAIVQCVNQLRQYLDKQRISVHQRAYVVGTTSMIDWAAVRTQTGLEIHTLPVSQKQKLPIPTESVGPVDDDTPETDTQNAMEVGGRGTPGVDAQNTAATETLSATEMDALSALMANTQSTAGTDAQNATGMDALSAADIDALTAVEAGMQDTTEAGARETTGINARAATETKAQGAPGTAAQDTAEAGAWSVAGTDAGASAGIGAAGTGAGAQTATEADAHTTTETGTQNAAGADGASLQALVIAWILKRPWHRGHYLSRRIVRARRRLLYATTMSALALTLATVASLFSALMLAAEMEASKTQRTPVPVSTEAAHKEKLLPRTPERERDLTVAQWLHSVFEQMPAPHSLLIPASQWLEQHHDLRLQRIEWQNQLNTNKEETSKAATTKAHLRLLLAHEKPAAPPPGAATATQESPSPPPGHIHPETNTHTTTTTGGAGSAVTTMSELSARRWQEDDIAWSLRPFHPQTSSRQVLDEQHESEHDGVYLLELRH